MQYSKFQKILSGIVVGFFLFGLVFRIPFYGLISGVLAGENRVYSLVSVLVSDDVYSGTKRSIKRYAEDISSQLPNTRVVIVPTPKDATAFEIASLNENLYYEGYKGVKDANFESRLVGSIFVGSIPVPVVSDGNSSSKTILPYTDFEDKKFIYDHENGKYLKSTNNIGGISAEIWHGVISPNTGDLDDNIDAINDYFDKNHSFYEGSGKFKNKLGIINGNPGDKVELDYEPYVFYFDQFREQAAFSYTRYSGYEAYLQNKEDLVYNRFSKELAQKISSEFLGEEKDQIRNLISDLDSDIDLDAVSSGPDVSNTSDITTRYVTKNVVKKFIEVINSSTLGEFRKDVHNAGRYNGLGSKVNVDLIPYLISVLDVVGDEVIKGVNNSFESQINELVLSGLSRNIAVPLSIDISGSSIGDDTAFQACPNRSYQNFLHGATGDNLQTAADCTIYRGSTSNSGTLVQANRGLDVGPDVIRADLALCKDGKTSGYWGGNSPINVSTDGINSGQLSLKSSDLTTAISPLFGIKGAKKTLDASKIPTPLNCFDNNYLLSVSEGIIGGGDNAVCEVSYQLPINGKQAIGWSCNTTNQKQEPQFEKNFSQNYKSVEELNPLLLGETCDITNIVLGSETVKSNTPGGYVAGTGFGGGDNGCFPTIRTYSYKKIASHIFHVSPGVNELGDQIKGLVSPNLPIDKDRYVDFIGASGNYASIQYPYLFRLGDGLELSGTLDKKLETISQQLDSLLDAKSAEINAVISSNNPSSLSGDDRLIYDLLTRGPYPSNTVDLKKDLKAKPVKKLSVDGDEKDVSYYDTLVFSLLWNNMTSVGEKYKFVFENYLTDQFESPNEFALPKAKKMYEIAYLGAPGDAQNMYINMDPESKGENPYAGIVTKNLELNSQIFSNNISDEGNLNNNEGVFRCAPPEGVPIYKWIPAVMCWLKDMLPPKVSISGSQCGADLFGKGKETTFLDFGSNGEVCGIDDDKNGVSDCLEEDIIQGSISLSGDSTKISPNKTTFLQTDLLDKDGNAIIKANNVKVKFELVKIEAKRDPTEDLSETNIKIVYDAEKQNEKSQALINRYVSFKNMTLPSQLGRAKTYFTPKNKESNLYFKTSIILTDAYGKELKTLESNQERFEVRDNSLSLSSNIIGKDAQISKTSGSIEASNLSNIFIIDSSQNALEEVSGSIFNASASSEKLVLSLSHFSKAGRSINVNYPVSVSITKEGKKIKEDFSITQSEMALFKGLIPIKEAGKYKIKITDSKDFSVSKSIQILPSIPSKIDVKLGSSIIQTSGNPTSNLLVIEDRFGNVVSGKSYGVHLKIAGSGLGFPSQSGELTSSQKFQTYEGFSAFNLEPLGAEANNTVNIEVVGDNNETLVVTKASVSTVSKIQTVVTQPAGDISVGGNMYNYTISLKDKNNNILKGFNSRVYAKINPIYGTIANDYVEVIDGKANIELTTSGVASDKVTLELNIEGLSQIIKADIAIKPEKAIKIDMVLSKSKLEASPDSQSVLQVELKDRYNNIVHTDSETTFLIENNYDKTIGVDNLTARAQNGKAQFTLNATNTPGTSYLKVRAIPSLTNNSFTIGEGDNQVEIKGFSENAIKIQSFYFWKKDKIFGKSYNSLYSNLLGAPYGDVTQKDYLAGALLFDKNNRSLAVTSLLNSPKNYNEVISFGAHGGANIISSQSDLSQDINTTLAFDSDNKLYIDAYNDSLNTYIGRTYYNFPNDVDLKTCIGNSSKFGDCNIPNDATSISLMSLSENYKVSALGEQLSFSSTSGESMLIIGSNGRFSFQSNLSLEINKQSNTKHLELNILSGQSVIGKIAINFVDAEFISDRGKGGLTESSPKNAIIMQLASYMYGTKEAYSQDGKAGFAIHYNDPFGDDTALNSFSKDSIAGFENFEKEKGVGWKDGNKSLLSFASGKNVGESVKDYASFNIINLGDPVISLKKIPKKFNGLTDFKSFDSTVGQLLSNDDNMVDYRVFDYDRDDKEDILLIKDNGYVQLLENKTNSKNFIDKGNLAYIADLGSPDFVHAGDFTGDSFGDIFFVSNKGLPFILNNNEKDFVRVDLSEEFGLEGKIVQAKGFDMDADEKMDIITLDDSGKIHIFYGGGTGESPVFEKNFIGEGYSLNLDSEVRNSGAFVYYDGLNQLSEDSYYEETQERVETQDYATRMDQALEASTSGNGETAINSELMDRLIFENISYSTGREESEVSNNDIVTSIPVFDSPESGTSRGDTQNSISDFLQNQSGSVSINGTNYSQTSTFIKSEYSNIAGVQVNKKFEDSNGGSLQSGDIVKVSVELKNISSSSKQSIAYVDTVKKPFRATQNELITSKGKEKTAPPGYEILVDEISLDSQESMTIEYELKVLPIKFGNIKVGLFEKDELGDDIWGDIILKTDEKSCGENVEIFRSGPAAKQYTKGVSAPSCNPEKLKLPDELEKNKIDLNNNGIPDHIDGLTESTTKQQEFAQTTLDAVHTDSDGDGIPDLEDDSPSFNGSDSGDNFLDSLDKINEEVDNISEGMDTLIEGFSCGFGGGSCISTPMNWAPLAAGQDPTLFGKPVGDGLKIDEGIPIFSAFTGMPVPVTGGCIEVPSAWPAFAYTYDGACFGKPGAGGSLGIDSPTNFARLFATPTLTGGFGIAACYGGPARVAGNTNPPGSSPVVPGGNCIVAAKPLATCSNDGSEGDPESLGLADQFGIGENGFGVVNANCSTLKNTNNNAGSNLDRDFVKQYFDYKNSGITSQSLLENYKKTVGNISSVGGLGSSKPLIGLNSGGIGEQTLSVDLDLNSLQDGNFEDVVEIKKDRVAPFPSFLMDWATRQIEEAVTKLTDLPTLFVILPDFGGLLDSDWGEHLDKKVSQIGDNVSTGDDVNNRKPDKQARGNATQQSGIKQVYEFLGNIPLIDVQPQMVNVEVPSFTDTLSIQRALVNWKLTLAQWEEQVSKQANQEIKNSTVTTTDNVNDEAENIRSGSFVNANKMISSLQQNIDTLESYQEIPEKLAGLLNKKEVWLEQVMCNVDAVSELTGGWIGTNGKRFKAWVELYMLIKAILKSWQLLVDVFIDYDTECHECKNERNDLLDFEFKLVDMIIPKMPVITFPKWPDIILDLHNVRAGMTVRVPDINITQRPLVLPNLPELVLPTGDLSVNVELPEIPLLPTFEIPELPDLPGIVPQVELPNLPPPPTIPKLFSSLEGILKILKLVAKAMCILKTSPFVPEWRSGDQIAFLTERQGFLPGMDFLDQTTPQFSLPFIDAIKVTTFVNLELETEFMVEMVKQIAEPISSTSSNIANKFSNAGLDNLDFSSASQNINIDEEIKIGMIQDIVEDNKLSTGDFAKVLSKGVMRVFTYMDTNKQVQLSSTEFLQEVNNNLASHTMASNLRLEKIQKVWEVVNTYSYSKEDKKIAELQKNNREKFETLNDILGEELDKTRQMQKGIEAILENKIPLFQQVTSSINSDDYGEYNSRLDVYNENFKNAAKNLLSPSSNSIVKGIKKDGDRLLSRVSGGLDAYKQSTSIEEINAHIENKPHFLSAVIGQADATTQNSCQQSHNGAYSYNYKGLYIVEKDKSYRLFDYLDELSGEEEYTSIDFDNDSDTDLLYMMNGQLFLKENLSIDTDENSVTTPVLTLDIDENKFFNGEKFIEAINGFREINTTSNSINVVFDAPTDKNVTNFKLEFYPIVDKFINKDNSNYIPVYAPKTVIHAFVSSDENTIEAENENLTTRKNLSTISGVGSVPGAKLHTRKMHNIKDDLITQTVTISKGSILYAGRTSFSIKYTLQNDEEANELSTQTLSVKKGTNIEVKDNIVITSLSGNAYVETGEYVTLVGSEEMRTYSGLPLFSDSQITTIPDLASGYNESSHISIDYYDGQSQRMNLLESNEYIQYDLGYESDSYLMRINMENDYYYGKISAFSGELEGTLGAQTLISPQIEADSFAPEITFNSAIRIPVYQKKTIDLGDYIFDNSGVGAIKDVSIDFNLDVDTNGDGDPKNDRDTDGINIKKTSATLDIEFGEFDYLVEKKIGLSITDENGNRGFKEINFEVYSPTPNITTLEDDTVRGGLDESLFGEPVNLYRVRGGTIKRLEDTSGEIKANTVDDGVYNFNVTKTSSGVILTKSGSTIATIDEQSGVIDINNNYKTLYGVIVDTDSGVYPQVKVSSVAGEEIYYQYMSLPENSEVVLIDDFTRAEAEGLFAKFLNKSDYTFYKIPTASPYNPGAMVVHKVGDISPLFTIFPDGRILVANELYKLEYSNIEDNIGLTLVSKVGNIQIAQIMYKIQGTYLMK